MATDQIEWGSSREREVSIATGVRVVHPAAGLPCQVQHLELTAGGAVRVRQVVPGDVRHLALWQALMSGEASWATAPALMNGGGGNGN